MDRRLVTVTFLRWVRVSEVVTPSVLCFVFLLHPKGAFILPLLGPKQQTTHPHHHPRAVSSLNMGFSLLPSELKLWNLCWWEYKRSRNKGRRTKKWSKERSWLAGSPFGCLKTQKQKSRILIITEAKIKHTSLENILKGSSHSNMTLQKKFHDDIHSRHTT